MRKNINLPVFAVIGAGALFVVLAGTARAIPDSMRETSDIAMRSWIRSNDQSDYDAVRSIGRSDGDQNPAGLSSLVVFGTDLRETMGKPHNIGSRHFDRDSRVLASGSPASVPDGGTTAMMLGGALCGIFFLAKKLKL